MGDEPGRRRRRVRPSPATQTTATSPPDQDPGPPGPPVTSAETALPPAAPAPPDAPAPTNTAAPPDTAAQLDSAATDGVTVSPSPRRAEVGGVPDRPRVGRVEPSGPAAPVPMPAPPPRAAGNGAPGPGKPAGGPSSSGQRSPHAGRATGRFAAGGRAGTGEDQSERGLRGLVGSGSSQVSLAAAMRARDAARPDDGQLADAERTLTIVRRNWVPREEL